jgi:hypothetical protein
MLQNTRALSLVSATKHGHDLILQYWRLTGRTWQAIGDSLRTSCEDPGDMDVQSIEADGDSEFFLPCIMSRDGRGGHIVHAGSNGLKVKRYLPDTYLATSGAMVPGATAPQGIVFAAVETGEGTRGSHSLYYLGFDSSTARPRLLVAGTPGRLPNNVVVAGVAGPDVVVAYSIVAGGGQRWCVLRFNPRRSPTSSLEAHCLDAVWFASAVSFPKSSEPALAGTAYTEAEGGGRYCIQYASLRDQPMVVRDVSCRREPFAGVAFVNKSSRQMTSGVIDKNSLVHVVLSAPPHLKGRRRK